MNLLLRLAPWYRPEELEQREQRAADAIADSKDARLSAERSAGRPLGSYSRTRLGR